MIDGEKYRTVIQSEDVTKEIFEAAEAVFDGWYIEAPRIDWQDFLDRLDGMPLDDGAKLDLGDDMTSPAIQAIKARVRRYRDS